MEGRQDLNNVRESVENQVIFPKIFRKVHRPDHFVYIYLGDVEIIFCNKFSDKSL